MGKILATGLAQILDNAIGSERGLNKTALSQMVVKMVVKTDYLYSTLAP